MSKARLNAQHAIKRENDRETRNKSYVKSPAPVKVTIQTTQSLPVSSNGRLKECRECRHSNRECNYCSLKKISIFPYQYGCFDFMTDEEYVRQRAESAGREAARVVAEWQKRQAAEEVKCNWLLTMMLDMIVGSQLILEDFERRTDMMFKNNPFPDAEDVANHKADKDWIFTHKYAFASIRKIYESMKTKFEDGCNKIRTTFESTIQQHIVGMCTNPETKSFDEEKYKRIDINAAEFLRLQMLVMNKSVESDSNFDKIVDFVAQLEGPDVFSPQDISRFKIK